MESTLSKSGEISVQLRKIKNAEPTEEGIQSLNDAIAAVMQKINRKLGKAAGNAV